MKRLRSSNSEGKLGDAVLLGRPLNTAKNFLRQRVRKLLNPMNLASFPESSCIGDPASSVDANREHFARFGNPIKGYFPIWVGGNFGNWQRLGQKHCEPASMSCCLTTHWFLIT